MSPSSSTSVIGPVIPRRRIAKELKLLREKAHLRLDEVAQKTEVSTSTLSRLENAQGTANALTIRALVDFYELGDTELGENLIEWARDGRKHGWWQGFPGAAIENTAIYVAYESQATTVSLYVIPYLPVLFHTPEYSEALAHAFLPSYTDEEISQLLKFRMRRQENLKKRQDQTPLRVRAILHESCLTQTVGSRAIMRKQLQKLLKDAREFENTVSIQVLPANAPPHRATRCVWSRFEYAAGVDTDVMFIETHIGLMPIEDPHHVQEAAQQFQELSMLSFDREESLGLIQDVIDQHFRSA